MWTLPQSELSRYNALNKISTEHRMWLNHIFGWEFVAQHPHLYKMTFLDIEKLLLLRIESLQMEKARKKRIELDEERDLLEKLRGR